MEWLLNVARCSFVRYVFVASFGRPGSLTIDDGGVNRNFAMTKPDFWINKQSGALTSVGDDRRSGWVSHKGRKIEEKDLHSNANSMLNPRTGRRGQRRRKLSTQARSHHKVWFSNLITGLSLQSRFSTWQRDVCAMFHPHHSYAPRKMSRCKIFKVRQKLNWKLAKLNTLCS